MSLYDADGTKQKPKARNGRAFYSHADCPTTETVAKRPSYVNVNSVGTYAFLYETTSSIGTTTTGAQINNYITGSKVGTNGGGIRLDISPVAWRRTDADDAVGDITFVYVRVM